MASRLGQSPQGPPRAAPGPRPRAPRPQRPSGADAAVLAADDRPTRRPAGREVAEGGGSAERGRAGPRVDAPHVGDDHDRSRASAPRTSDPPPCTELTSVHRRIVRRLAPTTAGLAIAARSGAPLRSWVKSSGDLESTGPAASPTSQATTTTRPATTHQGHDTYFAGAVLQDAHTRSPVPVSVR